MSDKLLKTSHINYFMGDSFIPFITLDSQNKDEGYLGVLDTSTKNFKNHPVERWVVLPQVQLNKPLSNFKVVKDLAQNTLQPKNNIVVFIDHDDLSSCYIIVFDRDLVV